MLNWSVFVNSLTYLENNCFVKLVVFSAAGFDTKDVVLILFRSPVRGEGSILDAMISLLKFTVPSGF